MAENDRKFAGIKEDSWSHLLALLFVFFGHIYTFASRVLDITWIGIIKLHHHVMNTPELKDLYQSGLKTTVQMALVAYDIGFALGKRSSKFTVNFFKIGLIKLLKRDFAGLKEFLVKEANEAFDHAQKITIIVWNRFQELRIKNFYAVIFLVLFTPYILGWLYLKGLVILYITALLVCAIFPASILDLLNSKIGTTIPVSEEDEQTWTEIFNERWEKTKKEQKALLDAKIKEGKDNWKKMKGEQVDENKEEGEDEEKDEFMEKVTEMKDEWVDEKKEGLKRQLGSLVWGNDHNLG